jgi:TolB-like protein
MKWLGNLCKSGSLGLSLLAAALGVQAGVPAIVVLPFDNATGRSSYDALAAGMPELLTACLSDYGNVLQVVERSAVEAAVNEQSLDLERYTEQGRGAAGGNIVAADFLVGGSIVALASNFEVQLLVFETGSARLAATFKVALTPRRLVGDLCLRTAPELARRIVAVAAPQATLPLAEDVERQTLLIVGLNHVYTGEFARAAGAFLDFTARYPQQSNGSYWLGRGLFRAGLTELARTEFEQYLIRFPSGPELDQVERLVQQLPTVAN